MTTKYSIDTEFWLRSNARIYESNGMQHTAMNLTIIADEIASLRARVARLEDALKKVRDYDCYKHPDDDIIAIREAAIKESENCTACQHAKKAKWPPSGLCNEHYGTVTRAQERVSQMFSYKQTWGPREIARRALEEK